MVQQVHLLRKTNRGFYRFKTGDQKTLMERAIRKAGSEIRLSELTGIPKSSIYALKYEDRNLAERFAKEISNLLGLSLHKLGHIEVLAQNWGQRKGGVALVKKKRADGTMDETILKLKKASSNRMKRWHKTMKENHPKKYYILQYKRFRKIGKGYPFMLRDGTKVRNKLEQEVGDFLLKNYSHVSYEEHLNINGKAYFPDFMVENATIEVTEWKHPSETKIQYLKKKLEDYQNQGYNACVYIPPIYGKFYKELGGLVISTLQHLKEFIDAPVA